MSTTSLKQEIETLVKELLSAELRPLPTQEVPPEQQGRWIAEALVESVKAAVKYAKLYDRVQQSSGPESALPKKRRIPGQHNIPTPTLSHKTPAIPEVAPPKTTIKEPKEDSRTTREIRRILLEIRPPITSGKLYKELKWKGTELTRAAVSGWFARANRRGELVESIIPGEYYLQGHIPPSKMVLPASTSEV